MNRGATVRDFDMGDNPHRGAARYQGVRARRCPRRDGSGAPGVRASSRVLNPSSFF